MAGRLVEVIDSSRQPHCFEYDGDDRITAWIDRVGYRYSYTYDEQGRVVATGGEDGTLAGRIDYDPAERVTRFTTALGETTSYRMDEYGHVVEVVDPRRRRDAYRVRPLWQGAVPHGRTRRHSCVYSGTSAATRSRSSGRTAACSPRGTTHSANPWNSSTPTARAGPTNTTNEGTSSPRPTRSVAVTRYEHNDVAR